jgi:hypothetical protein
MLDIQHQSSTSPTHYVILPCVTLNRLKHDTELVVGLYTAERRDSEVNATYLGLGDDPSKYVVDRSRGPLALSDDHIHQQRSARDHRQLVADWWPQFNSPRSLPAPQRQEIASLVDRANTSRDNENLATLFGAVAAAAPEYMAVQLFASGACGINHIHRADRLSRGSGRRFDAQQILDEALTHIDYLAPTVTQEILQLLSAQCS